MLDKDKHSLLVRAKIPSRGLIVFLECEWQLNPFQFIVTDVILMFLSTYKVIINVVCLIAEK